MPKLIPEFIPPGELSDDDISALVDIARRQADLRDELKDALAANDEARALGAARKLVGLEKEAERQ